MYVPWGETKDSRGEARRVESRYAEARTIRVVERGFSLSHISIVCNRHSQRLPRLLSFFAFPEIFLSYLAASLASFSSAWWTVFVILRPGRVFFINLTFLFSAHKIIVLTTVNFLGWKLKCNIYMTIFCWSIRTLILYSGLNRTKFRSYNRRPSSGKINKN